MEVKSKKELKVSERKGAYSVKRTECIYMVAILTHFYESGYHIINDGSKFNGTRVVYIRLPAGDFSYPMDDAHKLFTHLKKWPYEVGPQERGYSLNVLFETAVFERDNNG